MFYSKVRVGVGAEEAAGAGQYPVLFGAPLHPKTQLRAAPAILILLTF